MRLYALTAPPLAPLPPLTTEETFLAAEESTAPAAPSTDDEPPPSEETVTGTSGTVDTAAGGTAPAAAAGGLCADGAEPPTTGVGGTRVGVDACLLAAEEGGSTIGDGRGSLPAIGDAGNAAGAGDGAASAANDSIGAPALPAPTALPAPAEARWGRGALRSFAAGVVAAAACEAGRAGGAAASAACATLACSSALASLASASRSCSSRARALLRSSASAWPLFSDSEDLTSAACWAYSLLLARSAARAARSATSSASSRLCSSLAPAALRSSSATRPLACSSPLRACRSSASEAPEVVLELTLPSSTRATRVANSSEHLLSLAADADGLMLTNISVFESPPSESDSSVVSFESRYGTCCDLCCSWRCQHLAPTTTPATASTGSARCAAAPRADR